MHQNRLRVWVPSLLIIVATLVLVSSARAQRACFSAEERERAEKTAKVWRAPDPGYDPLLDRRDAVRRRLMPTAWRK